MKLTQLRLQYIIEESIKKCLKENIDIEPCKAKIDEFLTNLWTMYEPKTILDALNLAMKDVQKEVEAYEKETGYPPILMK